MKCPICQKLLLTNINEKWCEQTVFTNDSANLHYVVFNIKNNNMALFFKYKDHSYEFDYFSSSQKTNITYYMGKTTHDSDFYLGEMKNLEELYKATLKYLKNKAFL